MAVDTLGPEDVTLVNNLTGQSYFTYNGMLAEYFNPGTALDELHRSRRAPAGPYEDRLDGQPGRLPGALTVLPIWSMTLPRAGPDGSASPPPARRRSTPAATTAAAFTSMGSWW